MSMKALLALALAAGSARADAAVDTGLALWISSCRISGLLGLCVEQVAPAGTGCPARRRGYRVTARDEKLAAAAQKLLWSSPEAQPAAEMVRGDAALEDMLAAPLAPAELQNRANGVIQAYERAFQGAPAGMAKARAAARAVLAYGMLADLIDALPIPREGDAEFHRVYCEELEVRAARMARKSEDAFSLCKGAAGNDKAQLAVCEDAHRVVAR